MELNVGGCRAATNKCTALENKESANGKVRQGPREKPKLSRHDRGQSLQVMQINSRRSVDSVVNV